MRNKLNVYNNYAFLKLKKISKIVTQWNFKCNNKQKVNIFYLTHAGNCTKFHTHELVEIKFKIEILISTNDIRLATVHEN